MDNLTARAHTVNMMHAANKTTRRNVTVEFVEDDEFVRRNFQDEGGKSETFRRWTSLFSGLAQGEAATPNCWDERPKTVCK